MPQEPLNAMYAEENPYTELGNVDDNQKALLQVDMGAKAISYGEPIEEVPEAAFNSTVEELNDKEVETMHQEEAQVSVARLENLAETGREDLIPQTVAELQDNFAASQASAKEFLTPFVARVYNTPGAEHLTDSEVTQLAIDEYALFGFAKALDAQGGFETATDILNLMVLPDLSYNAAQLSDGDFLTSFEGMSAMAEHRSQLLPHEQIMFDKTMSDNIKGIEGSVVQQYLTMLDFMGKNPNASLEQYTEKVFLLGDVAALAGGMIKGLRGLNKMRQLSKVGDEFTATKAAEIAVAQGGPEAVGVPKLDAAMSGNPLKAGLQDDILSGTTVTPSSNTRTRVEGVERALDEIDGIVGVQTLPSEQELNDMVSKYQRVMDAAENIDSATVVKGVDGVHIDYVTPDGEFTKSIQYTIDDLGGFEEKALPLGKTLTRYVWSPAFLQGKDVAKLVDSAVIGSFQKARTVSLYNKALTAAIKPVKKNRESLKKVNDLLGKMNGKEVEVGFHKLVNEGIGGTRLSENEATTYMQIRRIFDHMHEVNNNTMRREMSLRGLKSASIDGEDNYVKGYNNAADASKAYHFDVDNNQVMVANADGSGSIASLTKADLEEAYGRGMTMVRSESSDQYGWFKDADGNHSRYALVDSDKVGGLPEKVLPYTPNYVPRLRDEANYFIKRNVDMKVNGNVVKREATVAWAKTETQAQRWVDKIKEVDPDVEFNIKFDREGGDAADATTVRMNGGLYRGTRSSSGIKYAGDNTDGDVVDALSTLQGNIRYTADRMSMSEMRQTSRHRWYQDAALIDQKVLKLPWGEARGAIADSNAPLQTKSKLLSVHDQVSNMSSIPAKSEQALQGALRAIGKHFDSKGKESAARWFYNNSMTSPVNSLKGGAFHMMLGAFNPAQYVVQFMGATVAVGANPVSFGKAVPRIMAASLTDTIDDSILRGKALETLRKKGIITGDMSADMQFWRDSGMFESVLRNNADFDNSGKFTPLDAGAMRRGMSSLASKSTVFYEMGELGSMRTSFFTALEQIKSQSGKNWKYDEQSLQRVIARAEQYRLGMSSANKAEFQKGLLALPTQFKSIYTKSLEAMFGKQFTGAEKSRIALSQIALFGATGVPFLNYFQDVMAEAFLPEDVDPNELLAFKKGTVGWLISGVWDVDAELTGRVAIAGDIVQEVEDMLFSEEPFIKSFLGASFTTTDKATDGFMNMMMAGKMVWEDDYLDSPEKIGLMTKHLAVQIANLPTSSRRLMEAWVLATTQEVRTSSGRTLYSKLEEDIGTRDVVARALGFSSLEMQDVYETNQAIYDRKDKVTALVDTYIGLINTMTLGVEESNEQSVEAVQMALSMVNTGIHSESDKKEILSGIKSALGDREFGDRTVRKWLELKTSELLGAKGRVFPTGEKKLKEVTE